MQEIPCFQGIKAIGILFFPFSSPQPFQKKKRKNTGLWEWIRCHWKNENRMRKKGKGRDSDAESHQLKYGGSRTHIFSDM